MIMVNGEMMKHARQTNDQVNRMKKQNCLQIDDVVCIRTDNIRQWELDGLYTTVGTV